MAKITPKFFNVRIAEKGDLGNQLREIVEGKMATDKRKKMNETVIAIILEYGEKKKK